MPAYQCMSCKRGFRTSHGLKIHSRSCYGGTPTSNNKHSPRRRSSRKSKLGASSNSSTSTSSSSSSSSRKNKNSTKLKPTKQVAENELELHLKKLVNKTFYKYFPGHGKYLGKIKKYLKERSIEGHPMFEVKYEDGDTETLTSWELIECGITVPVARPPPTQKRQTSVPQTSSRYPGGTEVFNLLKPPTFLCKKKIINDDDHHPLALDARDYGTVISVWMFIRRFSETLKLSTFSLNVFEDALMFDGSSVLLEDVYISMVRVLLESDAKSESEEMRIPYGPRRARLMRFTDSTYIECMREIIVEREGVRATGLHVVGSEVALDLPMSWSPMSACVEIIDRLIQMEREAIDTKEKPLTSVRGVAGGMNVNPQEHSYKVSKHFNLTAIRERVVSGFYDHDGGREYDPPCFICGKIQQTETNPGLLCEDCPACAHVKCLGLDDVPDGDWRCPTCHDFHINNGDLSTRSARFLGGPIRKMADVSMNGDDEEEYDPKYIPKRRGYFAGGPIEFKHDVKETFICFRKYHSYDSAKANEFMNLSYEMEEEFDRLYLSMVEELFLNKSSCFNDDVDNGNERVYKYNINQKVQVYYKNYNQKWFEGEIKNRRCSAKNNKEDEYLVYFHESNEDAWISEKTIRITKNSRSDKDENRLLVTSVPCSTATDRRRWRKLVYKLSTIQTLEEMTSTEKVLLLVWLKDALEQSSSMISNLRQIDEEYSDIKYDLLSLMTGDHLILPHRPAWDIVDGSFGFGGADMVFSNSSVKKDKKYAKEKLIGRVIRYTIPGFGSRDGRIVQYKPTADANIAPSVLVLWNPNAGSSRDGGSGAPGVVNDHNNMHTQKMNSYVAGIEPLLSFETSDSNVISKDIFSEYCSTSNNSNTNLGNRYGQLSSEDLRKLI
jgi:hypothetical protein